MADPTIRAAQLADLIRDYLAVWIARDYPGSFIGVSAVTLSPSLKKATAWLTFPTGNEALFLDIQKKARHYQHLLVTNVTRYKVPTIVFTIDTRPELS